MSKVYIAYGQETDGFELYGVFTTIGKAADALMRIGYKADGGYFHKDEEPQYPLSGWTGCIDEFELDAEDDTVWLMCKCGEEIEIGEREDAICPSCGRLVRE